MTVDDIRDELRNAIFCTLFHVSVAEVEQRADRVSVLQQKAIGFVELGVRCKLFAPAEGNDWLDAVWGRQVLAQVAMKYDAKKGKEAGQHDRP